MIIFLLGWFRSRFWTLYLWTLFCLCPHPQTTTNSCLCSASHSINGTLYCSPIALIYFLTISKQDSSKTTVKLARVVKVIFLVFVIEQCLPCERRSILGHWPHWLSGRCNASPRRIFGWYFTNYHPERERARSGARYPGSFRERAWGTVCPSLIAV